MRPLPILAGAVLALGLAFGAPAANAFGGDARIWVSLGDITFSAGRPYHRQYHYPLQIVHGHHGPRYFYHAPPPPPPRHVAPPRHGYGHHRHSPPPPMPHHRPHGGPPRHHSYSSRPGYR